MYETKKFVIRHTRHKHFTTMHSNWYIKIQRELQRPFPLLKSRITPKFRPFPTNTYQHKLWHFSTNTYPPNDPFPPTYLANQKKHQTEQHPTYHQRQPQANEQPLLSLLVAYNGSFKDQNPLPMLWNQHLATLVDFIITPLKKFTLTSNLTPKSQIKPIISSTKIMKSNNKTNNNNKNNKSDKTHYTLPRN